MVQPVKVVMPELRAPVQPDSVPELGLVPMARVTVLVAVVTTLPPASSTATAGGVANLSPATALPGCVVKATWLGGPTAMVKMLLDTGTLRLSAASVAVSV